MSINVNDKNLGHATAYAYYKAGGGTMTEAEFTEFMADFGTASQTAVEAAQTALASKNAAQTAATTATTKASEATTAATTATTKAGEASTSASTATSAKDTAVSASQTATTKASEATTAAATATSAKTDAVAANTAAQSAKTAAQTAQTGAETAAASVQESASQIAQNTSDISELKEDLNMFGRAINAEPYNPYVWEMGSYVSFSTGSTLRKTNKSPYNVTRKRFDVTEVTFNFDITANSGYYITLLEIDDSNVIVSTSGYVANVHAEAEKKYAGVVKASNDADITDVDINTMLSFSVADTQAVRNMKQIESISDTLDRIEPSLIEPINVDVIDGYGLKKSDGGPISNSAYQYTDYVPTDGVIEFHVISRAYSNICGACAYDANKNFIRSYFTTGNTALLIDDTITPLADEKFFRFSTVNKVTQPLIVVKYQYAENLGERVSATENVCADVEPFSGKTLLNFGDSISAGDGNSGKAYADYIAERYGMTLYDYSHGGDTLSTVRTNNIISQVNDAISDHSSDTIDYIFIEGGTNDIGNSVPLGEMVDGYDITSPVRDNGTIYGAVETIIAQLRNAFPTAKIIYVTAHKMATRSTAGQNNCHEAIVKTCEKWSLTVADIYLHGQINSNITTMLPSCFPAHPDAPETYPTGYDRTHPSEGGYKKFYVPYIVGVMRTI